MAILRKIRQYRHFIIVLLFFANIYMFFYNISTNFNSTSKECECTGQNENGFVDDLSTRLILITPTYPRVERLADMTRLSQTLMHLGKIHWIVAEDGPSIVPAVERILQRSKLKYTYLNHEAEPGFPRNKQLLKGMFPRNGALAFVHREYRHYPGNAVIYFADDDNSYDLRLFRDYLPQISTIGFWAVGLAGVSYIEAPKVDENGIIVGWHVRNAKEREFAIDMAGFGINLKLVLEKNATFHRGCIGHHPENCFLLQFGIAPKDCQAFGTNAEPKDILVWHTKTYSEGVWGTGEGYVVEKGGQQRSQPINFVLLIF